MDKQNSYQDSVMRIGVAIIELVTSAKGWIDAGRAYTYDKNSEGNGLPRRSHRRLWASAQRFSASNAADFRFDPDSI
jgi:hypothetical protein